MSNMPSSCIPRRPLLLVVILIISVFVLRVFLNIPFNGSGSKRTGSRSQISMLTYNVWFSFEKMRERMEALGQIVQELEPDVISFQEVTLDNLGVLKEQSWFPRYHLITPDATKQKSRTFVVILSVYPVDKWYIYPFENSPRNRKLIIAETKDAVSSSVKFVIAGTHLVHAGENTVLCELQLNEAIKVLSFYNNVCVMGDLNIQDKVDGDIVLPFPWIDAWLSLPGNTDHNGLTWDTSKIPFASVLKRTANATSYKAFRVDRVLCKLSDFKVKEMRIVGDKLTKSGILPSDHFGLFTVLELSLSTGKRRNRNSQINEREVHFKRPPGWEKLVKPK